jgi:hypothetical protein
MTYGWERTQATDGRIVGRERELGAQTTDRVNHAP